MHCILGDRSFLKSSLQNADYAYRDWHAYWSWGLKLEDITKEQIDRRFGLLSPGQKSGKHEQKEHSENSSHNEHIVRTVTCGKVGS